MVYPKMLKSRINRLIPLFASALLIMSFTFGAEVDKKLSIKGNAEISKSTDTPQSEVSASNIDQIREIRQKRSRIKAKRLILEKQNKYQKAISARKRDSAKMINRAVTKKKLPRIDNPFRVLKNSGPGNFMPKRSKGMNQYNTNGTVGIIDVQVNSLDADTIAQKDDFVLTVYFSSGETEADVYTWIDMDADGLLDESIDIEFKNGNHIVDNSVEDEDSTSGVYKKTFHGDMDGPAEVSYLGVLFQAIDGGGIDAAFLYIEPSYTPYSVSGTVYPPIPNIIIAAFPMGNESDNAHNGSELWFTVTDTNGFYQNFLPDSGYWGVSAFDFLDVTGGMIPDTIYFDVYVDGDLLGYDFFFTPPTAVIEGYVTDELGFPIDSIYVWANRDYLPGVQGETDITGYYSIGVTEGNYWVGVEPQDLIPDFLVPMDTLVYVADYDTADVHFTAYSTDSRISGTVFLDGYPYGGLNVGAWSVLGWTDNITASDGTYILDVSSDADGYGGYDLDIWDELPPGVIVTNSPSGILSGTSGVDIYLSSVAGGIDGFIYDAVTMNPIKDAWVYADDGMGGYGTATGNNGYYYLPLPAGNYDIYVGADDYYVQDVSNVIIQDYVLNMDFNLVPIIYDGALEGYVYDEYGYAIEGAEVMVGNNNYMDWTYTDSTGYYYFDLPNGIYDALARMDGYSNDWVEGIVIADSTVYYDFYLEEIVINSVIEGVVTDGETGDPIIGADVYVWSPLFEIGAITGSGGYFSVDVPSDTFLVNAGAPGYYYSQPQMVIVAEFDTVSIAIDLLPQMVQPPLIEYIGDVPFDQGRQVRIIWSPGAPPEDSGGWTKFSIWRLVQYDVYPIWDFVAVVPFHGMDVYSYVAPTLVDSNAYTGPAEMYWSTFMVTAHTMDPWEFYDSAPMDGYSIDNLSPHAPGGLVASTTGGSNGVELNWLPVPDEDFDYYSIYRGTSSGFVPAKPIANTIDTTFVDANVSPGVTYYYLVAATDFNGNEGEFSEEAKVTVLSTEAEMKLPDEFALKQNYPNPFNPRTSISFAVPQTGMVTITVYNLLGKEIARLVNEVKEAGRYTVEWDAGGLTSGVYLVQMRSDGFVETRKMMLLK